MDIYYKSDFTLIETFLDENGDAIDMTAIDFKIDYYTLSSTKYTVSKTASVYVNCEAGSSTNQLNVFFQKHGMPAGKLQREITLYITNPDFSPTEKVMTNPVSDIVLVAKGGDGSTASASIVYPAIVVPPGYYDIKDIADSTGLRAVWSAKLDIEDLQDADIKDAIADADEFNYLDSGNGFGIVKTTWLNIKAKLKAYFDTIYEAKKAAGENYVSDSELEVLQNTSGENTGDETEESIISKIGTDGQIKSDYLPSYVDDVIEGYYFESAFYSDIAHTEIITAEQGKIYVDIPTNFSYRYSGTSYINISNPLDYSNDIETDKSSTTKISAIKTFYDWATGLFATITNLNTKADISPENGSTSALRALYIARGYDAGANIYHCVYNTTSGYYEMNGFTDLTESEMVEIFAKSIGLVNINMRAAANFHKCRTLYPLFIFANTQLTLTYLNSGSSVMSHFRCNENTLISEIIGTFSNCTNLIDVQTININFLTNAALVLNCFNNCPKLVTAYIKAINVSFSFAWSPLLSLESLQYLVNNRANGTNRITITVHATVFAKLTSTDQQYADWNDLWADADANQSIAFATP